MSPQGISLRRPTLLPDSSRAATRKVLLKARAHQAGGPAGAKAMAGAPAPPSLPPNVAYDLSLQHPRCVYQLLKQQYSRYTPEMVANITGIPQDATAQSVGYVHLRPQRRRHEEGVDRDLRGRLDPAQQRHAGHSRRVRAAAADGKCWPRRRRRERLARTLQYSGRDRHGRHLRHPARLS